MKLLFYYKGIILFFLLLPAWSYAQIYRPPLKWYQLNTSHFRVIYHQGEEPAAKAAAGILEDQYGNAASLTGGSLHHFPVILNGYNDLGNGYVTPFLFHMEVEVPAMKGKANNPRTGGWFENVFPHELVHAMQFSVLPWPGISGFVKAFSPDLARSLQANIPTGFDEGLAVYNESNVRPGIGGRGNYAMFTNYFRANLDGSHPWSMGQLLTISGQTRPLDRHYIGGYQYVNWLESNYGKKTVRKIIDFDSRWPFLGLGVAVWAKTGSWPGHLYHEFERDKQQAEQIRLDSLRMQGEYRKKILKLPYKSPEVHRPLWLNNHTILFYASFYNADPGFYRYDLNKNTLKKILATSSVEDYRYGLNKSRTALVFANYRPSPIYYNDYQADIYEYRFDSNKTTRITDRQRVFAPVFHGAGFWGLQTDQQSARWVNISHQGKVTPVLDIKPNTLIAIAPSPVDTSLTAVVANRNGIQGIWFVRKNDRKDVMNRRPDIAFHNASVFDPSWSPDGSKLLFSCDRGGVMNIYCYDRVSKEVFQLTNSLYNALEASFSPDGQKIAYVAQQGAGRVPVVMPDNGQIHTLVRKSIWHANVTDRMNAPRLASRWKPEQGKWNIERYHTGLAWLRPRIFIPYFSYDSFTGLKWGAYFFSQDFLQRNLYSAAFTVGYNRLWYDAYYRFTGYYPGFILNFYHKTNGDTYVIHNPYNFNQIDSFTLGEKGFSVSIPIPVTLEQNVRYSSLYFEPKIEYEDFRFINSTHIQGDWSHATMGDFYGAFDWKLRQDIRDAQPNGGTVLFLETKTDLASSLAYKRSAFRAGWYQFLSPLRRLNQSLRLALIYQTQSQYGLFSTHDIETDGFTDHPLMNVHNVLSFQTRYTIPLITPDNGGFLIPIYLQQIYGTLFTNSVTDLDQPDLIGASRTIYGAGLHFVAGLPNIRIDLGIMLAWEATRDKVTVFGGSNY